MISHRIHMNIEKQVCDPPMIIISDGCLIDRALQDIGIEKEWVEELLKRKNLTEKDVFLLTVDKNKVYTLIRKRCSNG